MDSDAAAVAALLNWAPGPLDYPPFPDTIEWTRHMWPDGFNEYPYEFRVGPVSWGYP